MLMLVQGSLDAQVPPADSLSLDQAVRRAIDTHPGVREAVELLGASRARVDQSRSGNYPTADVDLGYARLAPVAEIAFPGLGDFKLFPENNLDEHISLRQTIFDFGKTSAAIDLNIGKMESAGTGVELFKTSLAYQTIQSFYAILFLHQGIEVQDQQIQALKEHLDIAQKKVQAGTATDFDVLTTQVRIAAAQNKRADLLNAVRKQEAVFRRLLTLPSDAPVRLRGNFVPMPVSLNEDSLLALARQHRIELEMSRKAEGIAEMQERVASRRDLPSLSVDASYGLKNGYIPNLDALRGNWVVGVEATIPIFNGFKGRSEEQEAQANRRAAQAHTDDVEHQIVAEVQQAISDLRANDEKLQTSSLQVEEAQQALAIARVRYESGVVTNLDLIDAQTALDQAQLARLDALYQYVVSSYALDKAVGAELP